MSKIEYSRTNVVLHDEHIEFLEEADINFSAFCRRSLEQFKERYGEDGFSIDVDEMQLDE